MRQLVRVPFADAMLVRLPGGIDPRAVASVADNVPDAWRDGPGAQARRRHDRRLPRFFTATIASARATIRIYGDLVQATRDGDVEALTAVVARLADANTQPAKAKRQIAACDPA
jgi:hypothetical protein